LEDDYPNLRTTELGSHAREPAYVPTVNQRSCEWQCPSNTSVKIFYAQEDLFRKNPHADKKISKLSARTVSPWRTSFEWQDVHCCLEDSVLSEEHNSTKETVNTTRVLTRVHLPNTSPRRIPHTWLRHIIQLR